MALVASSLTTTTMNLPVPSSSSSASTESLLEQQTKNLTQELLQSSGVHTPTASEAVEAKKRPLNDAAVVTSTVSNKRPRTSASHKRRVQFPTHPSLFTKTRTFSIDYENEDCWWTPGQSEDHMERQTNLLRFYATNCPELVDSVLLVWVHCAEEALADGNFCMTLEQRQELAITVAQSPVRGFEKELASDLISEQRFKTLGGLMELQGLCQQNGVTRQEKEEAMAAASEAFSQTATLFARAVAQGDAQVAKEYCEGV